MNILEFSLATFGVSAGAGFLGALTGLGGGVIIIPTLTLLFGVDLRYAIGAALISTIATSSGTASAYIKEGFVNLRVGMFLQVATTLGAVLGAYVAGILPVSVIALIFGFVLLASAAMNFKKHQEPTGNEAPDPLAVRLRMDSTYPTVQGPVAYHVHRVPAGFLVMVLAGVLSGLLGIGSGALKVLALDWAMKLPFKVSTTTSNFMIGVTAAASAGIYLNRGYIDPGLSMPVMLGVLAGSLVGAAVLTRTHPRILRLVFTVVIALMGVQMIYNGATGGFAHV